MTAAQTVSPTEASRILGVTRGRVHQIIGEGDLDAEQVDGYWRIRLSSVKKLKKLRESGERQAWRNRA